MPGHKWTPQARAKLSRSLRQRFASKRQARDLDKRLDAAFAAEKVRKARSTTPIKAEYVGEHASVDVNKMENDAFRRGMATALQLVIEVLIRELR